MACHCKFKISPRQIERGWLDIQPPENVFDGEHDADTPGSLSTPPVPLTWAARVAAGRRCVKPIGWLLEQLPVSVLPPRDAPDNFML